MPPPSSYVLLSYAVLQTFISGPFLRYLNQLLQGRCNLFSLAVCDSKNSVVVLGKRSDAYVLITVTPSPVPVFDGTKIKPGCTISCVGTYEPHKHELDPAVLPRTSKIYCDSVSAALSETGDLLIPIADGIISEDDIIGNIGDVASGKIVGRENDDEIIVYETVGVAAQDLCTAKLAYDKAVELGIGQELV